MTLEIQVDEYNERDKQALVSGILDLQEIERAIVDTRLPGAEVAEAYVEQLLKQVSEKAGAIFVARAGSAVAGFIACWIEHQENVAETPESNTYGYIMDAYVAPQFRRQGVFRKLNERAERFLGTSKIRLVRITVLAKNAVAIAAYEDVGYGPEELILTKRITL